MITVERTTRIKASKQAVWAMFQTREGLLQLVKGFVRDVELIGCGTGSRRIMHLDGQWQDGKIEELLTLSDYELGLVEYTISDTGGIVPFADYQGRIRFNADGPDATLMAISGRFMPVGIAEADARTMSEQNMALLIANLEEAFASN